MKKNKNSKKWILIKIVMPGMRRKVTFMKLKIFRNERRREKEEILRFIGLLSISVVNDVERKLAGIRMQWWQNILRKFNQLVVLDTTFIYNKVHVCLLIKDGTRTAETTVVVFWPCAPWYQKPSVSSVSMLSGLWLSSWFDNHDLAESNNKHQ